MARLNIEIPDKYLDVLNIIKITNKSEIENLFKTESTQSSTLQLLVLEFVKVRNMKDFEKMLGLTNINIENTEQCSPVV